LSRTIELKIADEAKQCEEEGEGFHKGLLFQILETRKR
jgi:hypothetical protein